MLTDAEQTALVGSVSEEFNTLPVENEEFRAISEKKALEALKPKHETVFIDKIPGKLLQPRNALPGEKGAFVVSTSIISTVLLVYMLTYISRTASNKTTQSQNARKQNNTDAPKRATGSCLPVLPRIQILAI